MRTTLNARSARLLEKVQDEAEALNIEVEQSTRGARIYDFGVHAEGGLAAGMLLARIALADLARVDLVPGQVGTLSWPHVQVITDHPLEACLLSQYAGWRIAVGSYFAMGSGPMRAVRGAEELFERLGGQEPPQEEVVGTLETGMLPDDDVIGYLAAETGVSPSQLRLCVARTASVAGSLQVVARSVETALHKLLELDFDVTQVQSGWGVAPLAPIGDDDLSAIGRTNDAILYGGRVRLFVRGDDASLEAIGRKVPSVSSPAYGRPFLDIFEDAGRDFYAIDPNLFSPAEVTFENLQTGRVHRFGRTDPLVLQRSFGI